MLPVLINRRGDSSARFQHGLSGTDSSAYASGIQNSGAPYQRRYWEWQLPCSRSQQRAVQKIQEGRILGFILHSDFVLSKYM